MITTRRHIVRTAGAAACLLSMPAIVRRSYAQPGPGDGDGGILPTPDFLQLRKDAQFVAGVRPHRKGGVRLSLEPEIKSAKGTKFLIHNYGHSGAGITLSWGCASVVCDHVDTVLNRMEGASTQPSVAILGSGVIGLTVAAEMRRKWPMLPMTIYAKTLDVTKTTSFIAGGQFEPSQIGPEYEAHGQQMVLETYVRRSADRIREMQSSGQWPDYGVAARKNYTINPEPGFDKYTPRDVVPLNPGKLPFKELNVEGREYSTWLMNPRILLPKLVADLQAGNVRFQAMNFQNRQQVENLEENLIINCTGYGAKKLFNDHALEAHRGHLVVLKNPDQLTYFFSGGCQNGVISYLFARQTDIVVGGTVVNGDERDSFDKSDPKDSKICNVLLDNIQKVFAGHSSTCAAK